LVTRLIGIGGSVSVDAVSRWVSRLPPAERDLPLLVVDNVAYSPNDALAEVRAGTPLGRRLQTMIETGRWGTPEEVLEALAAERLKKLYRERPVVRITIGGKWTSEELIREIEKRTPLGEELIRSEIEYMKRLRERYG